MVKQRTLDAQRVGGLLGWVWESPEVTAFEGERLACLRSPQACESQLRSQSLAACAICCQCTGYGASGRLPSRQKTGNYSEGDSSSVQTDARIRAEKIQPLTARLRAQGPAS